MIKFRGHQYRAMTRVASKETFYHGTAAGQDGEVLWQILKKGLEADPKDRRYVPPEDLDATDVMQVRDVEYVTYGGTYLASDLVTAMRYAQGAQRQIGGNLVIVTAQVETRAPEIAIDEDQFLSTVNIRLFSKVITDAVSKTTGSMAFGRDVYEAIQAGTIDLDKYVEPFLTTLLEQKPIAISVETLLRYRDEIVEMLHLAFEFEAVADRQAEETARDPKEIAGEFRSRANTLFRRVSGLADMVPGRNVRSLDTITYRGANRILSVLVFSAGSYQGKVQYSADNDTTARTAAEIESILGTRIDWGIATQKHYGDLSDWVDRALEVADLRMQDNEPPECDNYDVDDETCEEIQDYWSELVSEHSAAVLEQYRVGVHEQLLAVQRAAERCGGDDALELLDEHMSTLLYGGYPDDDIECIDTEATHAVVDNVVFEAEQDIFVKALEELAHD